MSDELTEEQKQLIEHENLIVELTREADAALHILHENLKGETYSMLAKLESYQHLTLNGVPAYGVHMKVEVLAWPRDDDDWRRLYDKWLLAVKRYSGQQLINVIAHEQDDELWYDVNVGKLLFRLRLKKWQKRSTPKHPFTSYTKTHIKLTVEGYGEHESAIGSLQQALESVFVDLLQKLWPRLEEAFGEDEAAICDCCHDMLGAALQTVLAESDC